VADGASAGSGAAGRDGDGIAAATSRWGEEVERYAIRLLDGGAVVRSAESGVPQWTYDAAMVAADGTAGRSLVVEVRQMGTLAPGRVVAIDFVA